MMIADEETDVQEKTLSDLEIIANVLSGDRDAYSGIVNRYQDRIYSYCLAMLADSIKAEEAAQEVFVKAYQALGRFRGEASFFTWLYRIAINHCKDVLRKTSRSKTESWEALLEKEGEKIEAMFAVSGTSEHVVEKTELITKILSCLPEKSRTLLILREAQGLSYEELAETTKCSIDSVKSRLKRTRQEIEKKLRHLFKS